MVAARRDAFTRQTGLTLDADQMWDKLVECTENGYVIGGGCNKPDRGLFAGHAYSVLDATVVPLEGDAGSFVSFCPFLWI